MGFFDLFKRRFGKKYETATRTAPVGEQSVVPKFKFEKGSQEAVLLSTEFIGSSVLVRPLMTEKSTKLSHLGQYVFEVALSASKGEVKESIKKMYGVEPRTVHLIRYKGERVVFRRQTGCTKAMKKAIVTLPKGKSIDVLRQKVNV